MNTFEETISKVAKLKINNPSVWKCKDYFTYNLIFSFQDLTEIINFAIENSIIDKEAEIKLCNSIISNF